MISRIRASYVRLRRHALYRRTAGPDARLIILRYHAVGDSSAVGRYVHPGLAVPATRFREHVRFLARRFRIVAPDEIRDLIASPRDSHRPAVLITFDDGYIDNYEVATPILHDEGARGTFYIATQPLSAGFWLWTSELWRLVPRLPAGDLVLPPDRRITIPPDDAGRRTAGRQLTVWLSAMAAETRDGVLVDLWRKADLPRGDGLDGTFVSPAQLRAMRAAGMTIGAHTRSHPQLDLLAPALREPELSGARHDLEQILGEPVLHLAYPNPGGNGTIQPPVRDAAAACGFETAVTSVTGALGPETDLLRLPRLGIYQGDQERQLFDSLDRLHERRGQG
jgi:peptidoglycan/xylan/chitin deacetylase (PgdA/CDA1 family)